MNKLALAILLTGSVYAQTPAATKPPTPVAPEVTPLEKAGLNQIAQEYQTVLQQLSQANIDVTKNHPGFHLDPQNPLSGKLVKDAPKPVDKLEAKPTSTPVPTEKK